MTANADADADGDDDRGGESRDSGVSDKAAAQPATDQVVLEYSKATFSTVTCAAFLRQLRATLGCYNDFSVVSDGDGTGWKTLKDDDSALSDSVSDDGYSKIHASITPLHFCLRFNPAALVLLPATTSDATTTTAAAGGGGSAAMLPPVSPQDLVFPTGAEFVSTTVAGLRRRIQQHLRSKNVVTKIEVPELAAMSSKKRWVLQVGESVGGWVSRWVSRRAGGSE